MTNIKLFFNITENGYVFEWGDVSAFLTILNVAFILFGYWWAPILGLVNCALCLWLNVRGRVHINLYVVQFALIILNFYFLKG